MKFIKQLCCFHIYNEDKKILTKTYIKTEGTSEWYYTYKANIYAVYYICLKCGKKRIASEKEFIELARG